MKKEIFITATAGGIAGIINGLLGAGGGMILVPLLTKLPTMKDNEVFPSSVSIILPICVVTLMTMSQNDTLPLKEGWPYLLGSIIGGLLAGATGNKIPVKWLHRVLGILILWGGIRNLC